MASKKTNALLWASLAASSAGITAVVAVAKWLERRQEVQESTQRLRDVSAVIADCHDKLHEIEVSLAQEALSQKAPANTETQNGVPARN